MKLRKRPVTSLLLIISLILTPFAGQSTDHKVFATDGSNDAVIPNEIIVVYKDDKSINTEDLPIEDSDIVSVETLPSDSEQKVEKIELEENSDVTETLEKLQESPDVEYAIPNFTYQVEEYTQPNDPLLVSDQWGIQAANIVEAWKKTDLSTLSNITIAVIDSGVDLDHEDLKDHLVPGWDFVNNDDTPDDDNGHGTHVAGIAAATMNNTLGVAGVAGGVNIMPLKVLNSAGRGSVYNCVQAIRYAIANGADVINLSLGRQKYVITDAGELYYTFDPLEQQAIKDAVNAGIVVVAATGNKNASVGFPAAYEETISVGAVRKLSDGTISLASFSNFGPEVDVVAPGVDIYSAKPYVHESDEKYHSYNGTSQATPFVSGLVALIKAKFPSITPADIQNIIQDSATDLGVQGRDDNFGYGLINGGKALVSAPAIPVPNNLGGVFNSAQSIELISTPESNIYYTTNGELPTISSPPYTGPISINGNTTLKAIAVKYGLSSEISESNYTFIFNRLSGLIVTSGGVLKESFTESYRAYTVEVAQDAKEIILNATVQDPQASLSINDKPYTSGENIPVNIEGLSDIKIHVSGEGVPTNEYVIHLETQPEQIKEEVTQEPDKQQTVQPPTEKEPVKEQVKESVVVKQPVATPQPVSPPVVYNPAPSMPAPAPVPAEDKTTVTKDSSGKTKVVVDVSKERMEKDLQANVDEVVIKPTSTDTFGRLDVQMPASLIEALTKKNKSLVIESNKVEINIPSGAIVAVNNNKNLTISSVLLTDIEARKELLQKSSGATNVSSVFDFEINNGESNISTFSKPLDVTLHFDTTKVKNKDKLGVYYYNEDSKVWEYVGGKLKSDSTIVFSTKHFSTFTVMEHNKTFKDITKHWAKEAIEWIASRHITSGKTADLFMPEDDVTRAEFAVLLAQALQLEKSKISSKEFKDVAKGSWFHEGIDKAYSAGIVSGNSDGTFQPNAKITREQAAIMILNAYGYMSGKDISSTPLDLSKQFQDANTISSWARRHVLLSRQFGLMNGNPDGTFAPSENASRAEAIVMIKALLNK